MSTPERMAKAERQKLEALLERLSIFDKYLQDTTVQEVTINDMGSVFLRKGHGWEYEENTAITFDAIETVGQALSNFSGKPFDRENTSLSAFFPTGERIEMTCAPQAPEDTIYLNLRKHSVEGFEHSYLVDQGYYAHARHEYAISLTDERRNQLYELLTDEEKELWNLVKEGKFPEFINKSIEYFQTLIASGATGSGKTAYIRSLIQLVDPSERIITAEDIPELSTPKHKNRQRLFYKKNKEQKEGAMPKEVLRGVMRKTPGRVFMAELLGDEAFYFLKDVVSSGHPGALSTGHGNSTRDYFFRLGLMIISSEEGRAMDLETIMKLLYMTINVVVQLKFSKEKGRYIEGIYYDPMYRLSLLG